MERIDQKFTITAACRATCQHQQFEATVIVNRLEDTRRFIADVTVKCAECGEPFRFLGAHPGLDFARPTVSVDGLELHAPIEPELVKVLHTRSVYQMPPQAEGRE